MNTATRGTQRDPQMPTAEDWKYALSQWDSSFVKVFGPISRPFAHEDVMARFARRMLQNAVTTDVARQRDKHAHDSAMQGIALYNVTAQRDAMLAFIRSLAGNCASDRCSFTKPCPSCAAQDFVSYYDTGRTT